MAGSFAWQTANEKLYGDSNPRITLDWDSPGFGRGFASMVLMRYVCVAVKWDSETEADHPRFLNESHYMYMYWIVGTFFDDIETLTLAVSLVRTFESIGSSVSFGIGAAKVSPMVNLVIAFVMFGFTIPATSVVVFMVPERPVDMSKAVEASSEEESEADRVAAKTAESLSSS